MSSLHYNHQNDKVVARSEARPKRGNRGPVNKPAQTHLETAKYYIAAVENVAHHGRTSKDPVEVRAVLRVLAEPSQVLKRLAEASRGIL